MAQFLTTSSTASAIETIIRKGSSKIVLITSYAQLSDKYINRIIQASERNAKIVFVFGKKMPNKTELVKFNGIENIELYFNKNVHAKCYYNEHQLVLTSMNLFTYSIENNAEMGILLENESDKDLFNEIRIEAETIIHDSELIDNIAKNVRSMRGKPRAQRIMPSANLLRAANVDVRHTLNIGYCIRCNDQINYDPLHPLCDSCFHNWARYNNADYQEKHCHGCGKNHTSSYAVPQCKNCYSQQEIFRKTG